MSKPWLRSSRACVVSEGTFVGTCAGHLLVRIDRKVRSSNGRPSLGCHAWRILTSDPTSPIIPVGGKTTKTAAVLFSHFYMLFRLKVEAPPNAQGSGRKRPETAPPGATTRKKRAPAQISRGGHTGERGGSARVIEARLDALRADDDARYYS